MKCGHYDSMQIRYKPSDDYYVCWDGRCLFCEEKKLQSENAKLKKALEALYAVQNGPPLIRDTDEWNTAMKHASELLPDY